MVSAAIIRQMAAQPGGGARLQQMYQSGEVDLSSIDTALGRPGAAQQWLNQHGSGGQAYAPGPAMPRPSSIPSGADVQTTIARESPDIEAYKLGLMEQARILASQPAQNRPQAQVAAPNEIQKKAYDIANTRAGFYAPIVKGGLHTGANAMNPLNSVTGGIADINNAFQGTNPFVQEAQQGLNSGSQAGMSAYQQAALQAMQAGTRANGIASTVGAGTRGEIGRARTGTGEAAARARASTTQAQQMLSGAGGFGMDAAQQGIAGLQGAGAMFDPNSVNQFMNPYTQQVIDQSLADIQRQGDIQGNMLDAGAVEAGAFGGSRHAIAESEHGRNVLDTQARTAANLRQQGFQSSMGQALGAYESGMGRQIQSSLGIGSLGQMGGNLGLQAGQMHGSLGLGAEELAQTGSLGVGQLGLSGQDLMARTGLGAAELGGIMGLNAGELGMSAADLQSRNATGIGSLGLNRGQLGIQAGQAGGNLALGQAQGYQNLGLAQSGIGELLQTMGLRDLEAMLNVGGQERDIRQQRLDTSHNNQLQSVYEPYQRLGFYSDILRGAPTSQQVLTSQTAPQPSLLNQLTGAATSTIGLLGAGKMAGII